jgi:peroxiredoxin Q/BCP
LLNVDKRKTFVIDPGGRIERILHHEVRIYRHLDDVLAHLRERTPAQLA